MKDKELLKLVTSFRKGILGKRSPLKKCFVVCSPLSTYLRMAGIKNELTLCDVILSGHNEGLSIGHYFITLFDGRIIDPTASQFNGFGNEDMPIVYIGEKPIYYKVDKYY